MEKLKDEFRKILITEKDLQNFEKIDKIEIINNNNKIKNFHKWKTTNKMIVYTNHKNELKVYYKNIN